MICESLIQGTHCANLQSMIPGPQQTPENLLLADVVVHSAIVFNGMDLYPFNTIMNSPANLKVTAQHDEIIVHLQLSSIFCTECFLTCNA